MNNSQLADAFLDAPVNAPKLTLSPEEEADLKSINWNEIFLFEDED